ncbi:MAG: ABC transporter permease [Oscillospiraceae bacterium]|nr:ABC transporter permease [Oscillospiraceae bacterium]
MQVFNLYFKIIRACKGALIVYLVVFLSIAVFTSRFYVSPAETDFTETKSKIAIIDRDGGSRLAKGLTNFLIKNNTVVKLPDDSEKMQDALFFRSVEYIAIIPKGFTSNFEAGGGDLLETVTVPDSTSARYVDMQINKYLGAMRLAQKHSGLPYDKMQQLVIGSLDADIQVKMNGRVYNNKTDGFIQYFNLIAYAMLAVSTLGISTIMMVFNHPDIKKRNLCAPLKQRSINIQLALGSIIYAAACWLFMVICSIIIYGRSILSSGMLPALSINALAFTIVSTAIGLIVGILIKSYNVQAAIANILSLGMSFMCGVFVPQNLLSSTVLRFSKILPAYWYVRANSIIGSQNSKGHFDTLVLSIIIQLVFAFAIFIATLFISKLRRTKAQ